MQTSDLETLWDKYQKGVQIMETNYKRLEEKDR